MATAAAQIVPCPKCGAKNRVNPSRADPVCGKCKTPLAASTTLCVLLLIGIALYLLNAFINRRGAIDTATSEG